MKFFNSSHGNSTSANYDSTLPSNMAVIVKINAQRNWQDDVERILSKLKGVHRFELDVEQGLVKVLGNLKPERLMKLLNKSTRKAEIAKAYMVRDGPPEDIFFVEEECTCPTCAPQLHKWCNDIPNYNNYNYYGGRYYQSCYEGRRCFQQLPSCSPPLSYNYAALPPPPPPPALQYQPEWHSQQLQIEPYYDNYDSSACSIM